MMILEICLWKVILTALYMIVCYSVLVLLKHVANVCPPRERWALGLTKWLDLFVFG